MGKTTYTELAAVGLAGEMGAALGEGLTRVIPPVPHGPYLCVPDHMVGVLADCIAEFAAELLCAYHQCRSERECTVEQLVAVAEKATQEWGYSSTVAEYTA